LRIFRQRAGRTAINGKAAGRGRQQKGASGRRGLLKLDARSTQANITGTLLIPG
jgi:hypothetical protein